MSNYKFRVYGDNRKNPPRKFKPKIFFDEKITESSIIDEEKKKIDQDALNQKLDNLELRKRKEIQLYISQHDRNVDNLKSGYSRSLELLNQNKTINHEQKKLFMCELEANFNKEARKLGIIKEKSIEEIKTYAKKEEKALRDLFDSGNYIKGKFSDYYTLEVYQPKAERRSYVDDGCRFMLLPKSKIKNILIEDTIYEYYYGKPN
ncbi:unnamed protein product [Brachionus calyciflorus]|uniref:Uncharacterized protein n=1 Tax=Brachionus calyciflorus TaxID=104777 RepID=A0A814RD32_9BILA|nr:unnamed protein product [Brachionus calyciflorus]